MFSNNLQKYRLENKLTLKELSKNTGISVGYLCHLEKGTQSNPSISIMNKISSYFNKTISEIFFQN